MRPSLAHHLESAAEWLALAQQPDLDPCRRLGVLECTRAALEVAANEARFEAQLTQGVPAPGERR